jgi:hypothetical protein
VRYRYAQVPTSTTRPHLPPAGNLSYRELRAVYGDPADLPPILPRHQEALGVKPDCSCPNFAGFCSAHVATPQQAIADGAAAIRDAVGAVATKVDYRDMLRDDDQPWSPRTRLTASLGRRALATRVVDKLPAGLAAELADRLEVLIGQAVAEAEARIKAELDSVVNDKIDQISADREARARQAEEARRERFTRPSRLD